MTIQQLTDYDASLLELALRIARDEFKKHSDSALQNDHPRLGRHFADQAAHAERLRLLFEALPKITLSTEEER